MISINCKIKVNKEDDYEQAVEKLKNLASKGITKVVITKAYDEERELTIEELKNVVNILEEKTEEQRILIDVYAGSLIEASYTGIDEYLSGVTGSLNATAYVLLDIGAEIDSETLESIHEFIIRGKIPVIANPEKNFDINRNHKIIKDLAEMGCLFHLNIKSLKGEYGRKPKKTAKYLLKRNLYNFVEIDDVAYLDKLSKKQRIQLRDSSVKLINNRYISNHKYEFVKRGIFQIFKGESKGKVAKEVEG